MSNREVEANDDFQARWNAAMDFMRRMAEPAPEVAASLGEARGYGNRRLKEKGLVK